MAGINFPARMVRQPLSGWRLAICFTLGAGMLTASTGMSQAATAQSNTSGGNYYSYKNLETLLNQEDKPSDWRQGYRQIAPPAKSIPGPNGETRYNYREPSSMDRSFHTFFPWRGSQAAAPPPPPTYSGYSVSGSSGTTGPSTPQSNPFNLSPFGILHYLWDPTTYVSNSNPVSLMEVRSDLQVAQQQSALAQSAARRAKYAGTAQERQEAAAQARQYAAAANEAAQRAQQVSEGGSTNPAEVAALASQEASQASQAARQAYSNAGGGW